MVALDLLLLFCVLTLSSGGKEETEDPPLCFFPVSGKRFVFFFSLRIPASILIG